MKELSIEVKAKRYDEAVERARYWEKNPTVWSSDDICQKLFPELVESEGEQHRKWILEYLYDGLRKSDEQFKDHFKTAIAWLEKQCERKPADKVKPKFKVGDKVKSVIDGFECTIESIDNTCYYGDTTNFDIQDQGGWELVEQKPWSEEDKRNFDIIYGIIYNSCNAEDASRLIAWLKSLKDRVQPQPKPERSEEDEKLINSVIELIDNGALDRDEKDYFIEKLKSLRPQKQWKPSATDIIVLEGVIDRGINPINYHVTLHEILEQLKKLMDE